MYLFKRFALILFFIPNIVFAQELEANKIIDTYAENQARFHKLYKGKLYKGEGIIREIRADILGTGNIFYIDIDSNGVNITCSTTNVNLAASHNKNDAIDFKGVISDVVSRRLRLDKCDMSYNSDRKRDERINANAGILRECKSILNYDKAFKGYFMCDADISTHIKAILKVCQVGEWCLIRGHMIGYGTFIWTKINQTKRVEKGDGKDYIIDVDK
jgi:hypothetical protein